MQFRKSSFIIMALCAGLVILPTLARGNVYVLDLDGNGDYVNAADNDNLTDFTNGRFTIQAWIFVKTLATDQPIASKWNPSGDQRSWIFLVESTGKLRGFISSDGTAGNSFTWETESAVININTWHHVAFVCYPNGSDKIEFYVDNVEYSHTNAGIDPPVSGPYNNTAEMWVGRFNVEYFYGYIDEFRLSDFVVTSFPDNVNDLPLSAGTNTEVLYHFDGAGSVADAATVGGNPANDGTLNGHASRRAWDGLGPGFDLPLPVTLVSMSAIGADELVKIMWATESEYDNLGFHLYRSTNQNTGFDRITSDLIPSQGYTAATQYYDYIDDRNLINGVTYYYKISDVDVNGRERTHQIIASATPIADTYLPGENNALAGYQLSQNYPNPFNTMTTIRYYVRETGQVKLSVYNLNGEEVTILVDEEQGVGEYFKEFDATGFPAGIYFIRLVGKNGYDNIKKMLFLK